MIFEETMRKKVVCCFTLAVLLSVLPVQAVESIKLGAIFAKSGAAALANEDHFAGFRLAIKEINKAGGVLGRPLEGVEFDNRSEQIGARQAAQQAVKAGVVTVVGNSWSSHSLAAGPVLQEAKIVMLAPDSTNADVTGIGDYIFRSCFTDSLQGKVLARFAVNELHLKKAALMVDVKSDYSLGLAEFFKNTFTSMGGQIVDEQQYTHNQHNFAKQLEEIKKYNPEVLFIPGHDEAAFIARQAQKIGIDAVYLFGDGMDYASTIKKGVAKIKKGFFTNHWNSKVTSTQSQKFIASLEKEDTIKLSSGAALTYDSVYLLADAISRAGSTDPEGIRIALANTHNYRGVTGIFNFNAQGDPIKSVVLMEIKDGELLFYKELKP